MNKNLSLKFKRVIALGCIMTMTMASMSGCGSDNKKADETTKAAEAVETTAESVVEENAIYKDATKSVDERVADLLGRMDLKEKVAQMIMAERNAAAGGATPSEVKRYGLGAVLSGGGSAPESGNTIQDWSDLINEYKQAAAESKYGIPLIYGVDSVHGNSNVYAATVFPHQIGMGATANAELAQEAAAITALETRAMGANYAFSPVLGIPEHEGWGRFYECFGEQADLVTSMGKGYITGLQGTLGTDDFLKSNKVICSAKHFIGEGQTRGGKNQGNVVMRDEEWNKILNDELLLPYIEAVNSGVQTVMVSYNLVNGMCCHENKTLVTDVLKGQLGFEGFVIGDYDGVEHCKSEDFKENLKNVVNAGVDMLMEPLHWQDTYYKLIQIVEEGGISEERIDDAVTRILRVKFTAGFFDEEINSDEEKQLLADFGSDEHRAVARQAVRESITLLKNGDVNGKSAMQALAEAKNIAVIGSKADDIGAQCGGWTISWTGQCGDITEGTTILNGFKEVAADKEFTHTGSRDEVETIITEDTDGVIIVIGEEPYSESAGDTDGNGLILKPGDKALIEKARAAAGNGVPVVVVLITGRPLQVYEDLGNMDGLVCAWLPGTEGAGIADVFFGEYDFNGKTPVTWPKQSTDITKKLTDESVVLYPYGTGYKKADITE